MWGRGGRTSQRAAGRRAPGRGTRMWGRAGGKSREGGAGGPSRPTRAPPPRAPPAGYARSIERLFERSRVRPEAIAFNVHGTTVATNTIIEGKQARTALLTPEGFRDL